MKRSGLGRGMDALLGNDVLSVTPDTQIDKEYIHELPLRLIDVNKAQPRKTFHDESLQALAQSIRENGLLQPITVHKKGERYEIVAGERRWRACRLLKTETIPAIIKELSPRQVCELSLIENLQREDLNPMETAEAIQALMREFDLTQEVVAQKIGASRPVITNALRLLKLPREVRQMIAAGELSAAHGRTLAVLDDEKTILALAEQAREQDWSVRRMEAAVKALQAPTKPKTAVPRLPEMERIEENMRQFTGTKVSINGNDKKGKIEIAYFSRDDLERLIKILSPEGEL